MKEPRGLRPYPDTGWAGAHRAYLALIDGHDPVAGVAGVVDLRPGSPDPAPLGPGVVSGPRDLLELRVLVDEIVGVGAWPVGALRTGRVVTGTVPITGPGPVLRLLASMEGLIEQRSPWGGWRHVIDSMASRIDALTALTIEAVFVDGSNPP